MKKIFMMILVLFVAIVANAQATYKVKYVVRGDFHRGCQVVCEGGKTFESAPQRQYDAFFRQLVGGDLIYVEEYENRLLCMKKVGHEETGMVSSGVVDGSYGYGYGSGAGISVHTKYGGISIGSYGNYGHVSANVHMKHGGISVNIPVRRKSSSYNATTTSGVVYATPAAVKRTTATTTTTTTTTASAAVKTTKTVKVYNITAAPSQLY